MTDMKIFKILFISLLLSSLLIGCSNQQQSTAETRTADIADVGMDVINNDITANDEQTTNNNFTEFEVKIAHMSYTPNSFTVKKGDKVKFLAYAATGTAGHMHGITIDEFNINKVVITEDRNNPVIIEFTTDKSGTFNVYCKTCWEGPFGKGHPDIKAVLVVE